MKILIAFHRWLSRIYIGREESASEFSMRIMQDALTIITLGILGFGLIVLGLCL